MAKVGRLSQDDLLQIIAANVTIAAKAKAKAKARQNAGGGGGGGGGVARNGLTFGGSGNGG